MVAGVLEKEILIKKSEAPSRAQRLLAINDVLFQTVRPYQKNNYFFDVEKEIPTVASTGYAQLRTSQNANFLYQLINTQNFTDDVLIRCTGSSYPAINSNDMKEILVKYPSVDEQNKIATFLNIVDSCIEKQQKLVEALKLYKRGVLNKLFNEYEPICLKTIGELSNVFSGGTPRAGVSEYYGGSIPFIRSGEIHNDKTELFLTEKGLKNSSAKMVEKGDLLFALYGATSGEVSISQINGAINQAILCIRPHSDITAQFLQIYLEYSKDAIISKLLQGGQGNLSGELVKGLTIPIFDINAQKTITNAFIAINNKINAFELYLFNLYKFKNGLLQQMFI